MVPSPLKSRSQSSTAKAVLNNDERSARNEGALISQPQRLVVVFRNVFPNFLLLGIREEELFLSASFGLSSGPSSRLNQQAQQGHKKGFPLVLHGRKQPKNGLN